ncbi:AAA family ATPase [Leptospira stimsonii]|uniref:NadR/Ttd14 AAA domain-containing protein n=1 Tax=Leptospira stimsonii TaxID=2202203 RepID=A0ABY2NA34_9LEPT|nr:AAA family ATPase [Leptospira stimsonii]TGK19025.1 hypothetical protein EHO98_12055 [Leptospira stimsonii]TGM18954.1 hypothetical protein EHQ90_05350 [Leptospira stimsonii]
MKQGLALGKFAPFHSGHQGLIEIALVEVEQLTVVIYDSPSVTRIPLPVRSNWIRSLYPNRVEVIEAWGASEQVGDSEEIQQEHERYLAVLLKDKKFNAFYSAEFYGDHISRFFKCLNRRIERFENVSGTLIRTNPFQYRNFLNPLVYRDMVDNIVFLGGPSTGKSTLAAALAEYYQTEWMPEYGREYWFENQKQHRLTLIDLERIASGHIEREDQRWYEAKEYLFTDTNVLTTYVYAKYYFGYASESLELTLQNNLQRYNEFIICDLDIPFEDTWDRSGPRSRELLQRMTIAELEYRKIKYFVVSGDLETRKRKIIDYLSKRKENTI